MPNGTACAGASPHVIEVEFSLALNNRTGKYFAAQEYITDNRDCIAAVRYWRFKLERLPNGFVARALGWLMTREVELRVRSPFLAALIPRIRSRRSILFTDPYQVAMHKLKSNDTVVVHDLGPVTHPDFYAKGVADIYRCVFSEIKRVGAQLVFVSQSSREEFTRLYGKVYGDCPVIYNPIRSETIAGREDVLAGVQTPFLLTVGAVGQRKNQASAIRAFELAGLAKQGLTFVICGGPEPGFEEVEQLATAALGVHLIGYVSDAELRWLYRNAEGFVLVSYLEGFGMPAAEAILRGLVPLLSYDAALQEVAGSEALYADASDLHAISKGLIHLSGMPQAERARRLTALSQHLRIFDNEKTRLEWQRLIGRMAAV